MDEKKTKIVKFQKKKKLSIREQAILLLYIKRNQYNIKQCMMDFGAPEEQAASLGAQLLRHELSCLLYTSDAADE